MTYSQFTVFGYGVLVIFFNVIREIVHWNAIILNVLHDLALNQTAGV